MKPFLTVLIAMLILVSCDRYESPLKPEDVSYHEKLREFSTQLSQSLVADELQPLIDFYSDSYLNNGSSKEDIFFFWSDIASLKPDTVDVVIVDYSLNDLHFTYTVKVYGSNIISGDYSVIVDTTITDYNLTKEMDYLLIGNREGAEETPNRKVLVEVFTGLDCINCTYVKRALHSLKRQYGDKFYYIEYHQRNELDFGNADIYGYYGVRSIPTGIIQGTTRIRGSNNVQESIADYQYAIYENFHYEADYYFKNFTYSVTSDSIFFNVDVTTDYPSIRENNEDLQLKYALIEKQTFIEYDEGETLKNVVISKGGINLFQYMDEDSHEAVINTGFRKPGFEFTRPAVILWIQTIKRPYDANSCRVENVFEQRILID